ASAGPGCPSGPGRRGGAGARLRQDPGSQPRPIPRTPEPGSPGPAGPASGLPELPRRVPGAQPPAVPGLYPAPEPPTRPAERPAPTGSRPDSLAQQSAGGVGPQQNTDPRERNSIESWMAGLRSARRQQAGMPADDSGRHQQNEGRSVSVNELLRRREQD
ncbi:hypothetical protein ABZ510_36845, partial [Nocardia rhamnosiphila]